MQFLACGVLSFGSMGASSIHMYNCFLLNKMSPTAGLSDRRLKSFLD